MSEQTGIPIWQIDAFTDQPFSGNPAAVCILVQYPSDRWMQQVAAEMNLAESAFVVPLDKSNHFRLRWFTPTVEVDLCGHATLAAAHLLFEQGRVSHQDSIRFDSRSGELVCRMTGPSIMLDFPATPPRPCTDLELTTRLAAALGVSKPSQVLSSKFDHVVVVEDERLIRSLTPDFAALTKIDARGVMVTAHSDQDGIDFVSRFFAPQSGINEDPVTGSAHCCLAPYWSERLGRKSLTGYQASSRGGKVHCTVVGDRVELSGGAVTVLAGRLLVAIQ